MNMSRFLEALLDMVSAPVDPARELAEARLERIRSISRAAMLEHDAADRAVVEFAETTRLLGDVAMVHPHQISEAAEEVRQISDALLSDALPEGDQPRF